MTSLVALHEVDVVLDQTRILNAITLDVAAGTVIGVAGPNGSGKTTLLRLVATLVNPHAGEGSVLDARLGSDEVFAIRRAIGIISHIPAVIPELTLEENLTHAVRLAGEEVDKVSGVLRIVGLEGAAGRKGAESSFGMLRRAEIARLLITKPRLLLLDEAFTGLDSDARILIDALIDRTLGARGAAMVVSHDLGQLGRATATFALSSGSLAEVA